MNTKYKKFLEPLIAIIASPFLSWNPSVLTLFSLSSAIIFFVGIIEHIYWLSIISTAGFLFDVIDGYVARKSKKESSFGAFLDSTCDRISDFFIIASFGFAHLVQWEIVLPVLFSSLLISYMRIRGDLAFGLGHKEVPGIMQRTGRIVILYIGFIFFLFYPALPFLEWIFMVILVLNCITILQRFLYFFNL